MDSPNVSATATDGNLKEVDGAKREVTPVREEAVKKRRKVVAEVDNTGESDEDYTVCQFEAQNLVTPIGPAINNYSVSMLVGKHGLFDLVLKVFEILKQENLTEDEYYDLRGSLVFDGKTYSSRRWGSRIDGRDIRLLHHLGLEQGQKGSFDGESARFDFVVREINGVLEDDTHYPKVSSIQPSFSPLLSDDWIYDGQIMACLQVRDEWQDYYSGDENSTKLDYSYLPAEIVCCKPTPPEWDRRETELLGLLINAGHKFTKSWKNILQYVFVRRTKGATSQRWYKLQKEAYRIEIIGGDKSNAEMTIVAKNLAKYHVENIPMPPTQAEILAERNEMIEREEQIRARWQRRDGMM